MSPRQRKIAAKRTKRPRPKKASDKRSNGRRRRGRRPSLLGTLGLFGGVVLLAGVGVGLVYEEGGPVDEVPAAVVWDGGRVRVDVQNGGGVTGMASAATDILRPVGFDVVKIGNAPTFDPDRPSVVIDRIGRVDQAQAVAKALGIDNVLSEPDANLYVDVTVVLGREWNPAVRTGQSPGVSTPIWWDPRGWFGS